MTTLSNVIVFTSGKGGVRAAFNCMSREETLMQFVRAAPPFMRSWFAVDLLLSSEQVSLYALFRSGSSLVRVHADLVHSFGFNLFSM
jgi:hypothetical protein